MRHFLLLLFALCTGSLLQGQDLNISISGVVLDNDGQPVEDIRVEVFTDSLPDATFYSNSLLTDAQGVYTDAFTVPGPAVQGVLYVRMLDCTGFFIYEEVVWGPNNTELVVDFTYCITPSNCTVNVFPQPNTGTIAANPSNGVPPYTYQWSTGATTASITPDGSAFYCVSVTDATGCQAEACYDLDNPQDTLCSAYISLEGTTEDGLIIEANGLGIPPYTYQWSTGASSSQIEVTASAEYCVTVTDSEGCEAISCAEPNIDLCAASIQDDPGNDLSAVSAGTPPFTYEWSTGATSSSIQPEAEGVYCVTITDAGGCSSSDCIDWRKPIDSICVVNIIPSDDETTLEAVANGAQPFAFRWSTGATTSEITNEGNAEYCVTVTDAGGCQAVDCYLPSNFENRRISGAVYTRDSLSTQQLRGYAFLIEYDEAVGTVTAIDTVELIPTPFGATYVFEELEDGEYLVKAALSPETPAYENNLPTYYGNVLWWDEATSISIPNFNLGRYDIVLIPGDNPGGLGFIGGSVGDGANLAPNQVENRGGGPIAGVSIILLNEFEKPVAYTYTDEEGRFEFAGLDWGGYRVVLEMPGHDQSHYFVTLDEENPTTHGLSFEVSPLGVVQVRGQELAESLRLFPNPAKQHINVRLESGTSGEVQAFITDFSGKIILQRAVALQAGEQQFSFDIAALPSGLYLLNILTNGKRLGKKFVKQ